MNTTSILFSAPLWTLLYCQGDAGIVRLLLDKGSRLLATDVMRRTPLHFAVDVGHHEIVELLLH